MSVQEKMRQEAYAKKAEEADDQEAQDLANQMAEDMDTSTGSVNVTKNEDGIPDLSEGTEGTDEFGDLDDITGLNDSEPATSFEV